MTFQANPESLPFLMASAISAALLAVAWTRRGMPLAAPFAMLAAGEAGWALFECLELCIVDLPAKRTLFALRAGAATATVIGLLAFTLRYTGSRLPSAWFVGAVSAHLGLLALAWTNPWHHLYWAAIRNARIGDHWIAMPEYGPAFYAHMGLGYATAAASALLLAVAARRTVGVHRTQALVMLFGVLTPWVVNILDMSRVFGFIHVDTAAMTFFVTGLALVPALFRFRLLDIVPVARTAVVQGMHDAVIVVDAAGLVVDLNPAAERLVGRPLREVLGQAASVAFAGWPALVERLERVLSRGRSSVDLDGPDPACPATYDARASRLEGGGGLVGWVVVLRDVTERHRAEAERVRHAEEREARARAEAENRAKDTFLAMLSHELRTPLTPVLAAVGDLLDEPGPAGELRAMLEMIRRNVDLEARLIDDLLDVTRIVSGKLHLHREVVDVHELIGEAIRICGGDIRGAGLELRVELAAAARHVEGDPARLLQVVWNLLKNAAKFTPAGGVVAVRTGDLHEGAPWLVIEVRDTGVGIDAEVLPRIFDAFEQGLAAGPRRRAGLGLGLAIGRSIAEAHGGRLTAASRGPGLGATFRLALPAVAAPGPAPAEIPAGHAGPGRPVRVLLIEDDRDTREILARLLRKRGFDVALAGDVRSALATANSEEFDVLVSDLGLPDGSGLDLMRAICTRSSAPMPGIALSGFGTERDVELSRAAGFAEHLTKPVDVRRLEASIRRLVGDPMPRA